MGRKKKLTYFCFRHYRKDLPSEKSKSRDQLESKLVVYENTRWPEKFNLSDLATGCFILVLALVRIYRPFKFGMWINIFLIMGLGASIVKMI